VNHESPRSVATIVVILLLPLASIAQKRNSFDSERLDERSGGGRYNSSRSWIVRDSDANTETHLRLALRSRTDGI
jgi:hypothetical protein